MDKLQYLSLRGSSNNIFVSPEHTTSHEEQNEIKGTEHKFICGDLWSMFWDHVESTHNPDVRNIADGSEELRGGAQDILLVEFINSDVACNLKSASVRPRWVWLFL